MTKTNVGGLPHGSYIVTDNSTVIAALNERIADLEKENELLKHVEDIFNASPDLTFDCCKKLFTEDFQAHNLEQQAKGVENAKEYYSHKWDDEFENVTVSIMKKGMGYIYPEGLGEYSQILRNEAKALKETK